ncbi:Transcription initiation factor TFIID subunit 5 [Cucurbita argyrosperma subsp. argyrosperma]|nr:Transcription initiation factor TFIID subunit 5 [Cucurbita argyrosperma subsp. argyrosperma]
MLQNGRRTDSGLFQEFRQNKTNSSCSIDLDFAKHLHSCSEAENIPARYLEGYKKLRSWACNSLDLYKPYFLHFQHELLRVLYPVFIHCFIDLVAKGHAQEGSTGFDIIMIIYSRRSNLHIRLQSKVNIKICQEKAAGLLSDSEKADGDAGENKKRTTEGGKQGASIKKVKDKTAGAAGKTLMVEANSASMAPQVKPELALLVISTEVEQSILEDLRSRVQLSSVALPSVSLYNEYLSTFLSVPIDSLFSLNAHAVWDMAKLGQQAGNTVLQGENGLSTSDQMRGHTSGKWSYTLFQGRSGPVHSATFSPIGDFVLFSSADTTVRLWRIKLNASLVCYKGHNYPVWDVQCVQWHANCNYITTGSSDRTVRLWDVESGECVRIFMGHRSMILSLAMSPDGRFMASGDEDGMIMMWDLSLGRCVTPLIGHTSCVWTLSFRNLLFAAGALSKSALTA